MKYYFTPTYWVTTKGSKKERKEDRKKTAKKEMEKLATLYIPNYNENAKMNK